MQSVSWSQSVKLSGQVRCCALFCLMPLSHTYLDCSKYLNNISQRKILYCKTKICQLLKNKSVYIYFKVIITLQFFIFLRRGFRSRRPLFAAPGNDAPMFLAWEHHVTRWSLHDDVTPTQIHASVPATSGRPVVTSRCV